MPVKRKLTKLELELQEKEFERKINEWPGFIRIPVDKILKGSEKRVSVEKLFKPEEYSALCKLEKKRLKNIDKNLTLSYYFGMPLPSETSLRAKVGLPPRIKYNIKEEDTDDDSDEDWKPYKSKPKKPGFTSLSDLMKRKLFITKKCVVDNEDHDPNALKGEDVSLFVERGSVLQVKTKTESNMEFDEEKNNRCVSNSKKDPNETTVRHSARNISTKNYLESKVLQEDDFLYCEDCNELLDEECSIHGPYPKVSDTLVKWGLVNRARRTCPQGISIGPSNIRSGGNGAWADKNFSKNSVFGPYEGVNIDKHDMQKLHLTFEGGYSWEIYRKGKLSHYIDGADEKKSNWLRFINCARNQEEQNLIAYQHHGKIYYRAFKEILRGMEFLVWYGKQYAQQLGISSKAIKEEKDQNTSHRSKPNRISLADFQACDRCEKIFSNKEALDRHLKKKHADRSIKKRHQCKLCDYSTDIVGSLRSHMLTHTGEKPFVCETCKKAFTLKGNLRRHERTHTGEKMFTCDQCGKKFNESTHLRTHIRTVHEKRLDYVCSVCGASFGQLGHLATHMVTHTGVRAYKCEDCGERFGRASALQRHRRTHTGERPYKCEQCPSAFIDSWSLRAHVIVKHTKRYPHRCSICVKGFLTPSQLQKHANKCH
ncbi:unnamed protein product [Clavelina lepadiformis]|uniref:Histone-lysine N-methyltransferase PRDM9 n=1 Tax=Clavelina lepadiformis TaxID=159417 RepID=A0ABP0GUP6_CLALP